MHFPMFVSGGLRDESMSGMPWVIMVPPSPLGGFVIEYFGVRQYAVEGCEVLLRAAAPVLKGWGGYTLCPQRPLLLAVVVTMPIELRRKNLFQVAVADPDVEEKVIDLVLASVAGQKTLVQQAFGGGVDGTGRGQGVFADESGGGDAFSFPLS